MRLQQQTHRKILDGEYRNISQTLYAPIDGVDPRLGGRGTPTPLPAANSARRAVPAFPAPQAPPPALPTRPATPNATQPDLMTDYRAVMMRASQARLSLAQAERKLTLVGGTLPDEILAARDRLTTQQQALTLAMRTRDNAAEQKMRDLEDTLVVIEKFVSK